MVPKTENGGSLTVTGEVKVEGAGLVTEDTVTEEITVLGWLLYRRLINPIAAA